MISEVMNKWQKGKDILGEGQKNKGIKLGAHQQARETCSVWLTSHFSFCWVGWEGEEIQREKRSVKSSQQMLIAKDHHRILIYLEALL